MYAGFFETKKTIVGTHLIFFVCVTLQAYLIGIGASICSGQKSWCLPYAGFFIRSPERQLVAVFASGDLLASHSLMLSQHGRQCPGENLVAHPRTPVYGCRSFKKFSRKHVYSRSTKIRVIGL